MNPYLRGYSEVSGGLKADVVPSSRRWPWLERGSLMRKRAERQATTERPGSIGTQRARARAQAKSPRMTLVGWSEGRDAAARDLAQPADAEVPGPSGVGAEVVARTSGATTR